MAQATNTFDTYTDKRKREVFADAIYTVAPETTPLFSLLPRESTEGVHPEWSIDSLDAPVSTNAKIEGDDYTFAAVTATARVGTYTQILRKEYIVTRNQEKISKAGPKSELGRLRRKKGIELRKDFEATLLKNQASVAGDSSTARKLGGLPAWLTSNTDRGAGGADGGFSAGLVTVATNGTQRAFTKAILDSIILKAFTSGGAPTTGMMSPYNKTVFSTFMSDANVSAFRTQLKNGEEGTINASADAYRSDFGLIDMVPNVVMAEHDVAASNTAALSRNFLLIDPDMASILIFDNVKEDKVAKTGDAEKRVLLMEGTLKMNNQKAHAVAADLFGLTSSN
jgi:hypothetical protein